MKKLLTIFFFLGLAIAKAQSPSADVYLPEHINLHLDKDFYFTGDRMWYSLYIGNTPRALGSLSIIAYVELRDSRDSVLFRQKLKCREGLTHGDWLVPRRLLTGNYKLSAFTLWAKNTPANIFSRTLLIVNPDIVLPPVSQATGSSASSNGNGYNFLKVSTSRTTVRPGDRIIASIELSDSVGNSFNGNLSVSVRQKNNFTEARPFILNDNTQSARETYNKEMFVSPQAKGTLMPIMNVTNAAPYPVAIDDQQMKDIMSMGMLRKIVRSYDAEPFYDRDIHYNIPANISYQPSNYTSLPSLTEFIKELVPQIKIRKIQSERKMVVRSIGSSAGVFYFKDPALVLVDGRIVDDIDAVLEMGLREIETVDITWDTKDINNLGLFSLADNGVISFITNTGTRFRDGYREIFKDFYSPLIFSSEVQATKDDKLPHLNDPVYWNPALPIIGKAKVEFEMSDNPGEYIVEVVGITTHGVHIYASTIITVVSSD